MDFETFQTEYQGRFSKKLTADEQAIWPRKVKDMEAKDVVEAFEHLEQRRVSAQSGHPPKLWDIVAAVEEIGKQHIRAEEAKKSKAGVEPTNPEVWARFRRDCMSALYGEKAQTPSTQEPEKPREEEPRKIIEYPDDEIPF